VVVLNNAAGAPITMGPSANPITITIPSLMVRAVGGALGGALRLIPLGVQVSQTDGATLTTYMSSLGTAANTTIAYGVCFASSPVCSSPLTVR
jgi:hypothetical protein